MSQSVIMVDAKELQILKDILQKVHDQGETIDFLKTQLLTQQDRIDRQDQIINDLTGKVEELSVKTNKEDVDTNSIWKGTENLSIAEAVKETAEKALMTNLGFVFDSHSKLYCNYSTGYYYDPTQELYYNGHTGTYYTYDADNQKYEFHSQVQLQSDKPKDKPDKSRRKGSHKAGENHDYSRKATHKSLNTTPEANRKNSKPKRPGKLKAVNEETKDDEDFEEGEISESESDETDCDDQTESDHGETKSLDYNDSSNAGTSGDEEFPPCIRAIILESGSSTIKKGALFLITCMGGTIGSIESNAIILPEPSVEKIHAKIVYQSSLPEEDEDKSRRGKSYFVMDMGSASGTFLNGKRLSEPLETSTLAEIVHSSIIKIGSFSILAHIHPGSFTCGHCEPGLLMGSDSSTAFQNEAYQNQNEKPKSRNALMKQIKKKYGIDKPQTGDKLPDANLYKDRARERRVIKGSDNPYEKTQVTTAEESIAESNKGFKMLAKMGWTEGKTLGNTGDKGLLEPIKLESKLDRAGFGLSSSYAPAVKTESTSSGSKKDNKNSKKPGFIPKHLQRSEQLAITLKRFKEAGNSEMKMEVEGDIEDESMASS